MDLHISETPIAMAIKDELRHRCRGRPAKRAALKVALTMLSPRNFPSDLSQALAELNELHKRITRAKVA
ncbi:MAG: hypothetical protein AB7G25_12205 [Sphingomonadaceae bacterium]